MPSKFQPGGGSGSMGGGRTSTRTGTRTTTPSTRVRTPVKTVKGVKSIKSDIKSLQKVKSKINGSPKKLKGNKPNRIVKLESRDDAYGLETFVSVNGKRTNLPVGKQLPNLAEVKSGVKAIKKIRGSKGKGLTKPKGSRANPKNKPREVRNSMVPSSWWD